MYKALFFLTAKPGMSRQDFIDYYETTHWKFVRFVPGVRKYIRRYLTPLYPDVTQSCELGSYDVLMEMWFDDKDAMKSALEFLNEPERYKLIAEDETKLFDRAKFIPAFTVEEHETDLSRVEFASRQGA
jgi:uncharacterized protein (TIGR02118 family)